MNADRKRKIVSLYHETERFVTLENLSSYIDERFGLNPHTFNDVRSLEDTAMSLDTALREQHDRPKTTVVTAENMGSYQLYQRTRRFAEEIKDDRMEKLKNAVYGVDESKKVGMEMVEKYVKENQTR